MDLKRDLEGLVRLENRGAHTTEAEAQRSFATLAKFRDGGIFAAHFSGSSGWEKHPAGDEIVLGVLGARATPGVAGPAQSALFQTFARALNRFTTTDVDGARAGRIFNGIDRCTEELFGRGEDFQVELISNEISGLLRRFPNHPLAEVLDGGRWPDGPGSVPVDLSRIDRSVRAQ